MNRQRRKNLAEVKAALNKECEVLKSIYDDLESISNEENEAFDNMPESLQESDRGETMQENIDALEEALESLESAIDSIEQAE